MKQSLSEIVQGYGYDNVKEFLAEYKVAKAEYSEYQSAVVKWEEQTGRKVKDDSLKTRLNQKQKELKDRNGAKRRCLNKEDRNHL